MSTNIKILIFNRFSLCLISCAIAFSFSAFSAASAFALSVTLSSFLGGPTKGADESIRDVEIDAQGNVYSTGGTASGGFPVTQGSYDTTFNGKHDVHVVKLNSAGQRLGGYGTRDGQGPVFICWRNGTNVGCRANYANETKFSTVNVGSMPAGSWHNFTVKAVWSHNPSVGRIELYGALNSTWMEN